MSTTMDNEQDQSGEQEKQHAIPDGDKERNLDNGGDKRWPGWPGDCVFRILVPNQKVGGLIGRKGDLIKKMCEESRSRIKILDAPTSTPERTVMISAREEPDAPLPPAIDGLLRVHKRIIDGFDGGESAQTSGASSVVSTRLLVPSSQVGFLIGKHGTVIKSIQDSAKSVVRVVEDLPIFALQDDKVVEIHGEAASVHKAVELVASHLRKFLVDHSVLPLFEAQIPVPSPHNQGITPHLNAPSYGANPPLTPGPPGSFFPPSDLHQIDKTPNFHPMPGPRMVDAPPQLPIISQVSQQMQIPLSYADTVIGVSGSTISYIRRASGATITIQETRGVPGEMTVEINGSASQVQTAHQLIQNFMAEAQGTSQNAAPAPQHDQSYMGYQSQGSTYGSPPSSAAPGGVFNSVYGSNYGY